MEETEKATGGSGSALAGPAINRSGIHPFGRMIDIPSLLPWSEPQKITTKSGVKMARTAIPTEHFWSLWRESKETLKSQGVSCFKDQKEVWRAFWWGDGPLPSRGSQQGGKVVYTPNRVQIGASAKSLLRDYQVPLVEQSVYAFRNGVQFFLNASGMGSGKTFCAAAGARELGMRPVVLARKTALNCPWREVLGRFGYLPHEIVVANPELVRYGKSGLGTWEKVGRKERFVWRLPQNSLLIWDEIHSASGSSSQLGEMLMATKEQKIPVLGLSATAANSPMKMKALGYLLDLHQWDDFYSFCYKFGCESGTYGLEFTCGLPWHFRKKEEGKAELYRLQVQMMQKIHDLIFQNGRGCRILTSEIPGFPENTIIPVALDYENTDSINRIYQEMQAELSTLSAKEARGVQGRAVMIRAKQRAELEKVPEIVEMVRNDIEEGMSVPIFVTHRETVIALAERLKTKCIVWGDQKSAERDKAIADFNADRERKIICTMGAGSESISLHDLNGDYPRGAIIIPGFFAEQVMQASARHARQGSKTKAQTRFLFGRGTIEEDAYRNFLSKQARIQAFNGEFEITDQDLGGL